MEFPGVAFKRGRVRSGPHEPGFEFTVPGEDYTSISLDRAWSVDLDEGGTPVLVAEPLLIPIDDGDERASWSDCVWKPTGITA